MSKKTVGLFFFFVFLLLFLTISGSALQNCSSVDCNVAIAPVSTVPVDGLQLMVGSTYKLTPAKENCRWESSNERVATVSAEGVVRGLRNGETTISLIDVNSSQPKFSMKFLIGTGIESVTLFNKNSDLTQRKINGYTGIGFGIITFETGLLHSKSSNQAIRSAVKNGSSFYPAIFGNCDFPSYGHCQMIEGTVRGFASWMLKDAERARIWNKLFYGVDIVCEADSAFTDRWKNSDLYLTDEEYVSFGLYQIEYMYQRSGLSNPESSLYQMIAATGIDPNRSRVLQEFFFNCINQGAFTISFQLANVNGNMSDKEIITAICKIYGTEISWSAGLTEGMRYKWYGNGNGVILKYYLELADANLPVFSFDNTNARTGDTNTENIVNVSNTKNTINLEKLDKK